MKKWSQLIESKKPELIEAIRAAEEDALRHTRLRFVVYLWDDGDITTLEDMAGGNTEYAAVREDKCISISEHCYQCWRPLDWIDDLNVALDELKNKMTSDDLKALAEWTAEWVIEWEEEPATNEKYDWITAHCVEVVDALENDIITEIMSEYDAEATIDRRIEELDEIEEIN